MKHKNATVYMLEKEKKIFSLYCTVIVKSVCVCVRVCARAERGLEPSVKVHGTRTVLIFGK
jgi:hypothetical protein